MDPVTLIVAALGAGVTVVANAAIGEVVKDAYANLKSLLATHFKGKAEHQQALSNFEQDPDRGAQALAAAIKDSNADADPQVVEASRTLLANADPDGKVAGKFRVIIQGNASGTVVGDHNDVNITFGTPPPK